jgi:hypothetical protein
MNPIHSESKAFVSFVSFLGVVVRETLIAWLFALSFELVTVDIG